MKACVHYSKRFECSGKHRGFTQVSIQVTAIYGMMSQKSSPWIMPVIDIWKLNSPKSYYLELFLIAL